MVSSKRLSFPQQPSDEQKSVVPSGIIFINSCSIYYISIFEKPGRRDPPSIGSHIREVDYFILLHLGV
jgi:hypothetical protein